MKLENKKDNVKVYFDSVSECLDFVGGYKNRRQKGTQVSRFLNDIFEGGKENSFTGGQNYDGLLKDLQNPVIDMKDALEKADAGFSDNIAVDSLRPRRRRRRRLDEGDEVNVDSYVNYEYDTMWEKMRREETSQKIIRLNINLSANYKWGINNFRWRTSAIVAIARYLEDLNVPFEIVAQKDVVRPFCNNMSFFHEQGHFNFTMLVKRVEQLLDIEQIAYVCGGIAFYRIITIGSLIVATDILKEKGELEGVEVNDTYGRAQVGESTLTSEDGNTVEFMVSGETRSESLARNEVERFVKWVTGQLQVQTEGELVA